MIFFLFLSTGLVFGHTMCCPLKEKFALKDFFSLLPGRVVQSVTCLTADLSDCRSRGRGLDPSLVPYFRGD